MEKLNVNLTDTNEPTFLSTFNFPLQNLQELEEVERYLEEKTRFQSTVCPFYIFGLIQVFITNFNYRLNIVFIINQIKYCLHIF